MLNQTQDDSDDSINNNGRHGIAVKKQYEGQDIRPTSTKEIYGWYSYGWVSCSLILCDFGSSLLTSVGRRSLRAMWNGWVSSFFNIKKSQIQHELTSQVLLFLFY